MSNVLRSLKRQTIYSRIRHHHPSGYSTYQQRFIERKSLAERMDEQLLELRRRKILTEVLEAFMVIFIFLGMLIFFTWVWLTDPAYAYPRRDYRNGF